MHHKLFGRLAALLASALSVAQLCSATPPSYHVRLLAVPMLNGVYGHPWGINEAGTVAGNLIPYEYDGRTFPYIAVNGVCRSVLQVAQITAINSFGTCVAQSLSNQVALVSNGIVTEIRVSSDLINFPFGINDLGAIVGDRTNDHNLNYTTGFVYANGVRTDLPDFGGGTSSLYAINNAGLAVGSDQFSNGNLHAVTLQNGMVTDIGHLSGKWCEAFAVSNTGYITGYGSTNDVFNRHAVVWHAGVLTDIGDLDSSNTYGSGVNDAGDVVGYTDSLTAFLYTQGHMYNLNNLLDQASAGYHILRAQGINNNGQIAVEVLRRGGGFSEGPAILDPIR